jgi:hypothetical protein
MGLFYKGTNPIYKSSTIMTKSWVLPEERVSADEFW